MPRRNGVTSIRLIQRLRELGVNIPEGASLVRTYVDRAARLDGSWAWFLTDSDGVPMRIGSQHPATQLLKGGMTLKSMDGGCWSVEVVSAESVAKKDDGNPQRTRCADARRF